MSSLILSRSIVEKFSAEQEWSVVDWATTSLAATAPFDLQPYPADPFDYLGDQDMRNKTSISTRFASLLEDAFWAIVWNEALK